MEQPAEHYSASFDAAPAAPERDTSPRSEVASLGKKKIKKEKSAEKEKAKDKDIKKEKEDKKSGKKKSEDEVMRRYMEEERVAPAAAEAMHERITARKSELQQQQQQAQEPAKPAAFPAMKAASMAPPPVAQVAVTSQTRPLDQFIVLQSASGAFAASDAFFSATKLTQERFNAAMPPTLSALPDEATRVLVWATAVALAFLSKNFASQQVEWDLIKEKSVKFVNRSLKAAGIDPAAVLAAAQALF